MFSTKTLVAFFAFAAPFFVRAAVAPTGPAPGDRFDEGSACNITWTGDKISTTIWKNMAIELMSGSNTNMQFITTIASGLDGTVDNNFSYPCPVITPHSPIYFYQFISPLAPSPMWTGRFLIASPSEPITPPTNSSTDADGKIYNWGTGGLVDPSKAVAPPSFASSISTIASNPSTAADPPTTPTETPVVTSVIDANSSPVSLSASA